MNSQLRGSYFSTSLRPSRSLREPPLSPLLLGVSFPFASLRLGVSLLFSLLLLGVFG